MARTSPAHLVLAAATVGAVVAGGLLLAHLVRPDAEVVAAPAASPAAVPTAVFLGDSYTEPEDGFAAITAELMGWEFINRGQGGTGYVTGAPPEYPERAPYGDRVEEIIALHPDIVVVAGGMNDANRDYDDATITAGIERTLGPLRAGLPDATIYVIGPFCPNGTPNPSSFQVRDRIKEVTDELGLPFVDPLGEKFITGTVDGSVPGNRVDYIGEDNTHPTPAGHQYLAGRVVADLRAIG